MIVLIAAFFVLACLKWGDWKNWRSYYSTILFFIAGDMLHAYITSVKPLWRYSRTMFSGVLSHLIVALTIYPSVVLLFFALYPKQGLTKKVIYIGIWVLIFSLFEYAGVLMGGYFYSNGWRFAYSVAFDIVLFPLLIVHQRKPQVAWLLSFILGSFLVIWFELPASH